jgi:hypothetical protein
MYLQTKIETLQRVLGDEQEILNNILVFAQNPQGFLDVVLKEKMTNIDRFTVRCAVCDLFPNCHFKSIVCNFDTDNIYNIVCQGVYIIELFGFKSYYYHVYDMIDNLRLKHYDDKEAIIIIR